MSTAYDRAELPPKLTTSEPGSFARRTTVKRKPQIVSQVIEGNDYPPCIVRSLEELREEVVSGPVRPLSERVPDVAFWNRHVDAYRGGTWLDVPWYFAEAYFYRRLLEAVHYLQPGPWRERDPFGDQKRRQEELALERLTESWRWFSDLEPIEACEALLRASLLGNRADLSNPSMLVRAGEELTPGQERHDILIDHTDDVRALLMRGLQRVDFVSDNVGLDLSLDLALADFLLTHDWVREIVFHLKDRPFFVSDAMPRDVQFGLFMLKTTSEKAVREKGMRLRGYLSTGRLILKDDPFWTSCLMLRQLPPSLKADLSRSSLVVLKGDANYRRLLGDRHWPYTTRMEEVTGYFPAPFLVLRALKSETMIGLEPGEAEAIAAEDPDWLVNGKRGVIQLVDWRPSTEA